MQIFPESVQKLWDEWDVRVMVLISLFLQIVLIIFSNRRKHTVAVWLRILTWSAYLSADWVATVCLGTLSNNYYSSSSSSSEVEAEGAMDPNKIRSTTGGLMGFWAPFLLLHLGGPGTITAYSLEDNELWLRHLLGLVVHVVVAFYVFLRSWRPPLSFLSIPMFVAGIIKYGERTWILRSASKQHFGDPLLPLPNPGPDYAQIVKDKRMLYRIKNKANKGNIARNIDHQPSLQPTVRGVLGGEYIIKGHLLFKKQLRYLYADLILSLDDQKMSEGIIRSLSSKEAFKVVEAELSFLYDVLYTKATLLYSPLGFLLRAISIVSTISTCVAFIFFTDRLHELSKVDINITYTLLSGAIFLEIYSFFVMIMSDWSFVWFEHYNSNIIGMYLFPSWVLWGRSSSSKRWCRRMGQSNLIDYCLRDKTKYNHDHGNSLFDMSSYLERYWYMTWEKVDQEMIEEPIFKYLLEMTEGVRDVKKLLRCRGDYVITTMGETVSSLLGWSIVDVEFDYSILLWHIATDLYNSSDDQHKPFRWRKISKCLSEYMLYLLVMCPFMLPKGIGKLRFRDTCSEAKRFFEQHKSREVSVVSKKTEACRLLLEVETEEEPKEVKGDKSKSVLFEACRLAKMLKFQLPEEMDSGEKWEMISRVWVEMLCYAASHCGWTQHGQQLRRGGELLTHVCLLMSHLGLSGQFQILVGERDHPILRVPRRGNVKRLILSQLLRPRQPQGP